MFTNTVSQYLAIPSILKSCELPQDSVQDLIPAYIPEAPPMKPKHWDSLFSKSSIDQSETESDKSRQEARCSKVPGNH